MKMFKITKGKAVPFVIDDNVEFYRATQNGKPVSEAIRIWLHPTEKIFPVGFKFKALHYGVKIDREDYLVLVEYCILEMSPVGRYRCSLNNRGYHTLSYLQIQDKIERVKRCDKRKYLWVEKEDYW